MKTSGERPVFTWRPSKDPPVSGELYPAEKALKILIPFFQGNHIWKYRAESLFQMAMVEKARGREAEALRWTAEAIQAAEPWRYVRIFTGYGPKGRELLEDYLRFLEKSRQEPVRIKKNINTAM